VFWKKKALDEHLHRIRPADCCVTEGWRNRRTNSSRKWDSSVMELPVVNSKQQCRPSLKAKAVAQLVNESAGEEQALYVLVSATGLRISEALALETKHFINDGRSIEISQQVDHDTPKIVSYLKTAAAYRQIDLCQNVANYLHAFVVGKHGLLFQIRKDTPFLHNNLEQRWLTPRLKTMGIERKAWAFTPSVVSERRGYVGSAAKRTSTIFGWGTNRKQCLNSIRAWTKNSNSGSRKRK